MSINSVNSSSSYLYNYGVNNGNTAKSSSKADSKENPFFSKVDSNQDGTVDQSELQTLVDEITSSSGQNIDVASSLSQYDTDQSGTLSDDELKAFMQGNDLKPAGEHHGPPPADAVAQTDASSSSGTGTDSSDNFSLAEYIMNLMSSMQDYLLGADSTDSANSAQTDSLTGTQATSPYQSNYAQVAQTAASQYSAQA